MAGALQSHDKLGYSTDPRNDLAWSAIAESYLASAVDSDNTRRSYRRHLHRALGQIEDWSGPGLAAYRARVLGNELSPASQAQALAALRSCLTWSRRMGGHDLPTEVIATALRAPRTTVRRPYVVLSDPEAARLLSAAHTGRDRGLLAVMLGAGLRVSEVVGLDVSDVLHDQDGGGALYVRQGKGRKDRVVPINDDVDGILREYLAQTGRRLQQAGPLFRSHDHGATRRTRPRLTARSVGRMVDDAVCRAGIVAKDVSPHSLRHTYAIRALRAGASVVAVSKLLGHSSIATTQRYLDHLELGELRAAVPCLPGGEAVPQP